MRHAATTVCWLSTAAIFRHPSILRNLICPLPTRLKSRVRAASSLGSEPCVFTRRQNSSWSRSITFVVRRVFHCALGKRKNVRSSSPPSRRLVTTPGHRFPKIQWKTLRTTNAIERLHEEFRRSVKTQGSLPSEDAALVLLFSLVASGQIKLRRIDGWRKIAAVLSPHTSVAA